MAKVYIHPSRGGRDFGNISFDGLYEKELTLKVAFMVRDVLARHDVDVLLSRDKDISLGVFDSISMCNVFDADLGVVIDFGSSQDGSKRGFEIHSSFDTTSRSYVAAQIINKHIMASKFRSNGVFFGNKYDRYAFIREANCPVVLCRCGYIDNIADYESIDLKEMATNIAKGILEYLGILYVDKFYSIQIGKFEDYEEANALLRELVRKGYEAKIV